jgi:uncharacterized protein (DUF3084 family)
MANEAEQLVSMQRRIDTLKLEKAKKEQELAGVGQQLQEVQQELTTLGVTDPNSLPQVIATLEQKVTTEMAQVDSTLKTGEQALGLPSN